MLIFLDNLKLMADLCRKPAPKNATLSNICIYILWTKTKGSSRCPSSKIVLFNLRIQTGKLFHLYYNLSRSVDPLCSTALDLSVCGDKK